MAPPKVNVVPSILLEDAEATVALPARMLVEYVALVEGFAAR